MGDAPGRRAVPDLHNRPATGDTSPQVRRHPTARRATSRADASAATMSTMTAIPPPLEYKAAAVATRPRTSRIATPDTSAAAVRPDTGVVSFIAAVTGGEPDAVGDVIQVGAFARSLRERTPRLCVGHDWGRVCGKVLSAVELPPGDPRLPARTVTGETWPPACGALLVRAKFLDTAEGRDQYAIAQAFGNDARYSIGYKVTPNGARQRGRVREITDLDLYEVSPVLFGAHPLAAQLSVKARATGSVETKNALGATARRRLFSPETCTVCDQPAGAITPGPLPFRTKLLCPECALGGIHTPEPCGICDFPAAATTSGGLPSGHHLICESCRTEYDRLGVRAGHLDPADLDALDQLEAENAIDAYAQALGDEQEWARLTDGTLAPVEQDEQQGRAWWQ